MNRECLMCTDDNNIKINGEGHPLCELHYDEVQEHLQKLYKTNVWEKKRK